MSNYRRNQLRIVLTDQVCNTEMLIERLRKIGENAAADELAKLAPHHKKAMAILFDNG